MVKQSQSTFTFWASGRRYCESLEATLYLKRRQELSSHILYLFNPEDDQISIDIHLNDESMDTFVFAVAQRKYAKQLKVVLIVLVHLVAYSGADHCASAYAIGIEGHRRFHQTDRRDAREAKEMVLERPCYL